MLPTPPMGGPPMMPMMGPPPHGMMPGGPGKKCVSSASLVPNLCNVTFKSACRNGNKTVKERSLYFTIGSNQTCLQHFSQPLELVTCTEPATQGFICSSACNSVSCCHKERICPDHRWNSPFENKSKCPVALLRILIIFLFLYFCLYYNVL